MHDTLAPSRAPVMRKLCLATDVNSRCVFYIKRGRCFNQGPSFLGQYFTGERKQIFTMPGKQSSQRNTVEQIEELRRKIQLLGRCYKLQVLVLCLQLATDTVISHLENISNGVEIIYIIYIITSFSTSI